MDPRTQLNEARQIWSPPAELLRCRPREVKLTVKGKFLTGIAFAMFAAGLGAGIFLFARAAFDREHRQQIVEQGMDIEARVVRRWWTRGDHPRYGLEIVYRASGQIFRTSTQLEKSAWSGLAEGSTLRIRYLPSDPERFILLERQEGGIPLWLPFVVACALGFCSWLILYQIQREKSLLSDGRPGPAVVTRLRNTKNGKMVYYTFATLSGSVLPGKSGPMRNAPSVGSLQCVLYEPDRTRRNAMYPFQFVRTVRQ